MARFADRKPDWRSSHYRISRSLIWDPSGAIVSWTSETREPMRPQPRHTHHVGSGRREVRRLAIMTMTLCVLFAGCGGTTQPLAPTTSSGGTPAATSSRVPLAALPTTPGPDTFPLHLNVTNQSFEIPEVRLVVDVDGESIIDEVFAVEDQHTWVSYELYLDAGDHEILVSAPEHAADLRESFTLDDERWALVSFWLGEEDATHAFSWTFSDEILLVE